MPTLPDLLNRLADDGDVAGFDTVFARATAAVDAVPPSVPMTPRRRRRSVGWTAAVAIVAAAAIAVPLIVTRSNERTTKGTSRTHVSTGPPDAGPPLPHVASATAAQLAAGTWSTPSALPIAPDVSVWDGHELLFVGSPQGISFPTEAWGYVPSTNAWQRLPAPHVDGRVMGAVWDGHEVLAWTANAGLMLSGAAYDPATQRWRMLAAPPDPCPGANASTVIWTGTRALLFGRPRAACVANNSNALPNRALVSETYDPTDNRWRTDELPSPQQPGESIEAIDAAFVTGRVVARIDSERPIGDGGSFGHRVATLRLGDSNWTPITAPHSAAAPVALDAGVAIVPGTICTPFMSCDAGNANDGRWYPPHGASGPSIAPPTTQPVLVTGAVSTGGALVASWTPLGRFCPAGGCPDSLSAWDPASDTWHQLPNAPPATSTTQLLWTGDALVWIRTTNGRLTLTALHPAATAPTFPSTASATAAQLAHFHWSTIAAPPLAVGSADIVAWDGRDVLVWSQSVSRRAKSDFAAYDPTANKWRTLPPAAGTATWQETAGVWTGNELVLFGVEPNATRELRGARYVPSLDRWVAMPSVSLCEMDNRPVVWTGTRVLVLPGYWPNAAHAGCSLGATAEYDPANNSWSSGPTLPVSGANGVRVVAASLHGTTTTVVQQGGFNRDEPAATYAEYVLAPADTQWRTAAQSPGADGRQFAAGAHIVNPPESACADDCPVAEHLWRTGALISAGSAGPITLSPPTGLWFDDGTVFDLPADTGRALFVRVYGDGGDVGSPTYAYAWDTTSGRATELPQPPQDLGTSVWTGHEILAFGGSHTYRFGP